MSMNPTSCSQPGDFQAQTFSWLEEQSSEINALDFTHLASISTPVPDPVGERWFLGLTPEGVNTVPGLPSPAKSSPSEPENVTRQAFDSDQAVDNITVKAPYNTPRKRPGRYKNAPAHILNRRREQCRVAQQKHRERKDNRIAQLEKELKSLQEEYQTEK
ncbi:uncharacterized protein TRIVIDRAFT_222365 [Trichoderma virens Gv29-8]|uniref:BZIP domain-containing protein n=1 Tax=Hypocrea virens (strain Gv29-8 / FGSC 10586) TaxID=413071 RepID=G9MT63_HYPVG|nr:uncharacterized protein TRIVIDRAFT_222365 [Trichoderma virens Gv29-8]EHK23105.1 hypothetical protein TRIVIDRAFT_222365 [Trichoderma virens Gv29-8]